MNTDVIQQFMEQAGVGMIKPSGDNLIGTCPFHDDKRRSFSMNAQTGQFICFSANCGEQGNLYSFLVRGCGYSEKRAQEISGEWQERADVEGSDWEVDMPTWGERRREQKDEQPQVEESMLGLYDFCPKYMTQKRGFTKATLRRWEIGYDYETERVTIPVRDHLGNLVGISKRTIHRNVDPSYLHLGFKRSRLLYGEFFCPKDAEVWPTEGQFDALALWQLGVPYPVSTMSARIGDSQIKRLKRYPSVVLAFDNDRDGIKAAMRVGDALIEAGHPSVYVARNYGDAKDAAELLRKGEVKAQRRFTSTREPYDLVRLEWIERSRTFNRDSSHH